MQEPLQMAVVLGFVHRLAAKFTGERENAECKGTKGVNAESDFGGGDINTFYFAGVICGSGNADGVGFADAQQGVKNSGEQEKGENTPEDQSWSTICRFGEPDVS